jgi:hypothetical protein
MYIMLHGLYEVTRRRGKASHRGLATQYEESDGGERFKGHILKVVLDLHNGHYCQ